MADATTTTRARIRAAIVDWYGGEMPTGGQEVLADRITEALAGTPVELETLTHLLEETRLERDNALAAAAHWRANAGEAERRKRHVSGLLNEALNERRDLVAELRRALYRTPLGEVMGRQVMAADVPLIDKILRSAQEGTHHEE